MIVHNLLRLCKCELSFISSRGSSQCNGCGLVKGWMALLLYCGSRSHVRPLCGILWDVRRDFETVEILCATAGNESSLSNYHSCTSGTKP